MPPKLQVTTVAQRNHQLRTTARVYLWVVKQLGRNEPKWVAESMATFPETWHEDTRFYTKLYRILRNHGVKTTIRCKHDQKMERELRSWMETHCP